MKRHSVEGKAASWSTCVFCGSKSGLDEAFAQVTREAARELVRAGATIYYGGGRVGLMGVLADEALAQRGRVIGIIPAFLDERELGHRGIDELVVVDTMHARKVEMIARADTFLALPGAFGTADELFEVLTLSQLDFARKPCVLVNTRGFFDGLITWLDRAREDGFLSAEHRSLLHVTRTASEAVSWLSQRVQGVSRAASATVKQFG